MSQPWAITQATYGARAFVDTLVWPTSDFETDILDLVDTLPATHAAIPNHLVPQPDLSTRTFAEPGTFTEARWVCHWYMRGDITVRGGLTTDQNMVLSVFSGIAVGGVLFPIARIPFFGLPVNIAYGTGNNAAANPLDGPDYMGSFEVSGRLFQVKAEANPSSSAPSNFRLHVSLRAI